MLSWSMFMENHRDPGTLRQICDWRLTVSVEPKIVTVNFADITIHPAQPPLYQPMMDALQSEADGTTATEIISVPAKYIGIPAGYAPPEQILAFVLKAFDQIRKLKEDGNSAFDVLERADGSIWSYDAPAIIAAYHKVAPDVVVRCRVLGFDPEP